MPQLISECFQQILDTAEAITCPLEQAFFVMVHLPYLQPFEDVPINGFLGSRLWLIFPSSDKTSLRCHLLTFPSKPTLTASLAFMSLIASNS